MHQPTAIYIRQTGTDQELLWYLKQAVETRGGMLTGMYIDDATLTGKGKNGAWRRLQNNLSEVHQIVLADPGDLPGRTVQDLLGIMATLNEHGVNILVPSLDIDTNHGTAAILDLIRAYRRAKWSAAIRAGQEKARQAGRKIGRPPIPPRVRLRIMAEMAEGGGIRCTATKFNISPASVVAIRDEMLNGDAVQQAA